MFPPARLLFALVLLCLAALARPAGANTLNVPAQYPTIQAAINASVSGDTVLIADGTYTGPGNVDLDFGGRNSLTVTSVNGTVTTTIDCAGSSSANHRGFYLHRGETNAVISGLTIANGYESESNYGNGGGIYNASAGLTLQNCVFQEQHDGRSRRRPLQRELQSHQRQFDYRNQLHVYRQHGCRRRRHVQRR